LGTVSTPPSMNKPSPALSRLAPGLHRYPVLPMDLLGIYILLPE